LRLNFLLTGTTSYVNRYATFQNREIAMNDDLTALLEAARDAKTTPEHREEQRRTFAFGNTHFENSRITREMVDRQADELAKERERRERKA
jgi:hypothetical protein